MLIYNFIIKSPTYILVHMYFGQKKKKKVGPSAVSQHMKLHYKIFYLLTLHEYVCPLGKKRKKQVGPIAVSQHEKLCVKIKSKVQLHYKYVKSTTTLHKKPF